MNFSIGESVVTHVWFNNDHRGNPASRTTYHINICYVELPALTAFLEYAGEHLKRYQQYERLFAIHCLNDHGGSQTEGLYYSVSMETQDRKLANKFRLFWIAHKEGKEPVVQRDYEEDPMTPEEEAELEEAFATAFSKKRGGK